MIVAESSWHTVSMPIDGSSQRYPLRRIFCVGRNYSDHVREMGNDPARTAPVFFTKWADSYLPAGSVLPYPPGTADLHHEVELAVAISTSGRNIAPAGARAYIFGYACALDLTRRDLQAAAKAAGQPWDTGKNFDGSAILGPLARAEALPWPLSGAIWLDVAGERRQSGDLSAMIWPVDEIIAELSKLYELRAGDIIFTGTPAGVGPLVPGDHVSAGIAGLPALSLTIGAPD